jgi:hypothetical protein
MEGTDNLKGPFVNNLVAAARDTTVERDQSDPCTRDFVGGRLIALRARDSENLRLPDIRRTTSSLPLAGRLTLSRSIDHIREFLTRAIEERTQL